VKRVFLFLSEKFQFFMISGLFVYFLLSATATATATVAPTMGLLPIENPEISLFYFGSKVQILHHFSIFIKQSSVLIVSHFI